MAWWAILYTTVYCLLAMAGFWSDYEGRKAKWFLGCAISSNLVIAYLYIAYWYPTFRVDFGPVVPTLFVAALCWEIFQLADDMRTSQPDPELSAAAHRGVAIVTTLCIAGICFPAYAIAGIVAFTKSNL